jgi:hypothetical protein
MDDDIKTLFNTIGLETNDLQQLNGLTIPRDILLSDNKYDEIKCFIPDLKKKFSSSFMTSLQKNAETSQKWPLLNLVRQILHVYGYKMEPIRKADGYTLEGVKRYKRYFMIHKKNSNNQVKKIDLDTENNIEDTISDEENDYYINQKEK